ncbi:MAG TPA: cytochrome c peroxidase, partial [Chitinophagales bacterium]|nr:cytochrome c peroxidase [Chitinophagales bacterium]
MKTRIVILGCMALFSACVTTQSITFLQPTYFPQPTYQFSENSVSESKVYLGRVLFYDPILSGDSSISCASCHSSYNAFSHTDHKLSHGIRGE